MNNLCFMTNLSSSEWAAWVQAVGSVAAILVAVGVSYLQHWAQERRDRRREAQDVENMLYSIQDEIEVLREGFNEKIGMSLMQSARGTAFLWSWPAPERPFVVYEGCKDKLGKIEEHGLRRLIIVTYARAEGLLQDFRTNNALIEKHDRANHAWQQTPIPENQSASTQTKWVLDQYGDKIRDSYTEVDTYVKQLITALEARR